ncbi:MAG: acyltransferase [Gemmatimonadaceae bacterium]|nr:acyltransferase [Gemmatimonadaceae bacterium]
MSETDRRIPSLDGIRGGLLLIVLFAHLLGTRNFPLAREAVRIDGLAYTAMRTFFVISGFLITGILLRELNRRGTVNIFRFYFKRTFRIFPAYYVFLAFVGIAAALGLFQLKPGDMLHAVTYTSNYNHLPAWQLGHSWSLSVEEQFYMLWPAVLVLLGIRRASIGLLGLLVVLPVWRIFLQAIPPGAYGLSAFQDGILHTFDTTADIIAVGCLLAIFRERLWAFSPYRRFLERGPLWAVFVYVVVEPFTPILARGIDAPVRHAILAVHEAVGLLLVNLGLALLVDWSMRNAGGRVGRVLNSRLLISLGVMSYSCYLWQQIFLNRNESAWWNAFPVNVLLALGVAMLSHRLVELPMLSLRERLDAKFRAPRRVEQPAS